ncbi:MAG: DUF2007 domain-containing protein [Nitrospirota bacterium]|nr:DUF2007 domain-containing protein [Nitrospirota bacterium]MDE3036120.1 DUF2007 domain-containing protein [Nitrospirota bacterium]MDE3117583.1 DUF2007 domain-containing protein [Nitrospirota bacterium]MDE3224037.1 DUF2007 domain-containing protein [Nitrospirota bacterium]MDE3244365.1 DUF2007 domain-containing protein [Nitrospirota bacterium]
MDLVRLIEPQDEGELALIKSLLDGNGIRYFVKNEHFGSLYPGFPLPFNRREVMVHESELGRAGTLLENLTRGEGPGEAG